LDKKIIVANVLSRVEELQSSMDYSALAASQETDEELKEYNQRESGLRLEKIEIAGAEVAVFRDTTMATLRPFRRAVFKNIHNLAQPGINAAVKFISQRYVWPLMRIN